MAHKTFISYKYSESQELRDLIIEKMGEDAIYYNGENGFSPNKSDDSEDAIWNYLKDMIWPTSVTIVILSPEMLKSSWIESEISYSLKKISRDGKQSKRNGVVAIIKKVDGSYDWFKYSYKKPDGHIVSGYYEDKIFQLISKNRRNQKPPVYTCDKCKSINPDTGSFISFVEQDKFLEDVNGYVEKAFNKAQNDCAGYEVHPTV